MQNSVNPFKTRQANDWTAERIAKMTTQEIEQLRDNALRLDESEVVTLCDAALSTRPRAGKRRTAEPRRVRNGQHFISRAKAFEARGVHLDDARTSWGGVRKSDGTVVLTLWADSVRSRDGGCSYLLWAPNIDGSRPWSDSAAGRERLEHCRLALARGSAEGLLVHGERLEGYIPEEKARSVDGVAADTVLHVKIELRGKEYWAAWGKKEA